MDALKIIYNLLMHSGQFFVYSYGLVFICFLTLRCIGTATAVFTLIDFFLPAILGSSSH